MTNEPPPSIYFIQVMVEPQAPLVAPLGKASGRDVDKKGLCAEAGWPWIRDVLQEELLPGCIAYLEMKLRSFHVSERWWPLLFFHVVLVPALMYDCCHWVDLIDHTVCR